MKISVLCGYAGTGKTFTTAELITRFIDLGLNVAMVAPTHKAARQIGRAMSNLGLDLTPMTLHSMLGMKPYIDYETGKEHFKADGSENQLSRDRRRFCKERQEYVDIPDIDVIIVDETSMVSEELYVLLMKQLDNRPIVFVGDDRQLLPVKETKPCPAFYQSLSTYRLTEVLRHDGAILTLATETRMVDIGRARFRPIKSGGSEVIAYRYREEWYAAMLAHAEETLGSEDPDIFRVLCWTNANVSEMNRRIHIRRYGLNAPQFQVGMQCVTDGTIVNSATNNIILHSTADILIASAQISSFIPARFFVDHAGFRVEDKLPKALEEIFDNELPYKAWDLEVVEVYSSDSEDIIQLNVIHEDEIKRWKDTQSKVAAFAKAANAIGDKVIGRRTWELFHRRKNQIARIQPSTALTIHKSQGSTFDRVFLHPDIDGYGSRRTAIQNQLAYVGITRASRELHVVADR